MAASSQDLLERKSLGHSSKIEQVTRSTCTQNFGLLAQKLSALPSILFFGGHFIFYSINGCGRSRSTCILARKLRELCSILFSIPVPSLSRPCDQPTCRGRDFPPAKNLSKSLSRQWVK